MTDSVTVDLKGRTDIIEAMRDLRSFLPKNALRSSVRQSAVYLQQLIALVAPKLTGKLARNIVVKTRITAKTVRARVTVNTIGNEDNSENAFYWRFLEEGFHTRSGQFRQFPFVVGVFDSKNRTAAQMVIDSCEKAIERAERKANRNYGKF